MVYGPPPLRVDCRVLARPASARQALIEQFVEVTTRRLATVLAD
jgi:hypothetical protein